MRPADAYVASFVREINRGKVVQVGALAESPGDDVSWPEGRIFMEATLEVAAREFAKSSVDMLSVVDKDDRRIGVISMKRTLEAMVAS